MANAQDVAILDVRGRVKTELRSKTANGTRLEMSEYLSDYDMYLEGHIPGNAVTSWISFIHCCLKCNLYVLVNSVREAHTLSPTHLKVLYGVDSHSSRYASNVPCREAMIRASHALALHNSKFVGRLGHLLDIMSMDFSNAIVGVFPVMPRLHVAVKNDRQQSGDGRGSNAKGK